MIFTDIHFYRSKHNLSMVSNATTKCFNTWNCKVHSSFEITFKTSI